MKNGLLVLVVAIAGVMLLLCLLTLFGCPKPQPAPGRVTSLIYPAPFCSSGDAQKVPQGTCDNKFTSGGFLCVICEEQGCVDGLDQVYCARSCADVLCQ